jgi:hypothetical protein
LAARNPIRRKLAARVANLSQYHPDDPELPVLREQLRQWAEAEAAAFPPPTDEQVAEWAATASLLDGRREQAGAGQDKAAS